MSRLFGFGAVWLVLAIMFAIAGTILMFIFLLPEKKRAGLNPFFRKVADLFNFKELVLEKILKAFYILSTLFVVSYGIFTMFNAFIVAVEYDGEMFFEVFFGGLLFAVLGAVAIRLVYEGCMLLVLLTKNVMDINKKIPYVEEVHTEEKKDEVAEVVIEEKKVEAAGVRVCSNCGATIENPNTVFCSSCGKKL